MDFVEVLILVFVAYNLLMAGLCKFVAGGEGDTPPSPWTYLSTIGRINQGSYNTRFIVWLFALAFYEFFSYLVTRTPNYYY